MNKGQLVAKISEEAGISKSDAGKVVTTVLETITKCLKKDGKISVTGLGTFTKTKRKARKGRNPRTGESIKIKATTSARFKASKTLKEAL